jgi:hypothetical protein
MNIAATTKQFNRTDRVTGTASTHYSDPQNADDRSISVIITLDQPVGGTHRWIFWSDLAQNTITIRRSIVDNPPYEITDVFRVDDFTGLFDGEIPTADQMIEAATSWLEEQSAFD